MQAQQATNLQEDFFQSAREQGAAYARTQPIDLTAARQLGREIGRELAIYQSFIEASQENNFFKKKSQEHEASLQGFRAEVQEWRFSGSMTEGRQSIKRQFKVLLATAGLQGGYRDEFASDMSF